MSVRCIASGQKGGVGKSTLAVLTARTAVALGIKLAVVDLAMGNPSTSLHLLGVLPTHTLATHVIGASKLNEVIHIVSTEYGPVYLVPSGRGDLSLVNAYGDVSDRVGAVINYLVDRVGVDYVIIDFPSFEPNLDDLFANVLMRCDIVYPVGIQDPGSLAALKNLHDFVRKGSVSIGRPVINMFRESLGRQWVGVVSKLFGAEPSVIHYDPWLIRWVQDGGGYYGIGIREALTYIIKYVLG